MALSTLLADDDIFPGFNPFRSLMAGDVSGSPALRPIPIDVVEKDDKFEIKVGNSIESSFSRFKRITCPIDATKDDEKDEDVGDIRVHRIERRQQFVQRRVRLPESADMTAITAKMDNGTLVIDIPKNPDKVQQRQIDVK
ncbi:hypothetical protein CVIRNUC_011039 [Coccomyxa viridis]|uniref:SHSP domain-containing protein n=1 Tax=Coccomyxa viridis TaxID=1274662 RepID=A0AAV1IKM6_9CHLO|nr:hypothetical protein CVIRNUC_011039 [Coccomyxa viridis]